MMITKLWLTPSSATPARNNITSSLSATPWFRHDYRLSSPPFGSCPDVFPGIVCEIVVVAVRADEAPDSARIGGELVSASPFAMFAG